MELTARAMVKAIDQAKLVDQSNVYILIEVEGGVVQNVQQQGFLPHPIRVLVRDYDNMKVEPHEYQDEEWTLGVKEDGA